MRATRIQPRVKRSAESRIAGEARSGTLGIGVIKTEPVKRVIEVLPLERNVRDPTNFLRPRAPTSWACDSLLVAPGFRSQTTLASPWALFEPPALRARSFRLRLNDLLRTKPEKCAFPVRSAVIRATHGSAKGQTPEARVKRASQS
jgi:hypothetical protein